MLPGTTQGQDVEERRKKSSGPPTPAYQLATCSRSLLAKNKGPATQYGGQAGTQTYTVTWFSPLLLMSQSG